MYLYLRFSRKSQENGLSVKRQKEYAAAYCEREGLALDRTFGDEGVSGHKGRHRRGDRAGGLAEFLALCKSGDIPRGSYLLVESFDRLSREHPLDAMELLKVLLRDYGIVLVVMRPEMKMTADSLSELPGIMAFIEAMRAYGESATKSDRSRYNWEEKRRKATQNGEIAGARVPSWCEVKDGKIVLHPEKSKAVRLMFDLCRKGLGQELICQELIKRKVPPINRSGRWYAVYVRKVLNSRTTVGEWQPRMLVNGKLAPVGDVIKDYYPAVVTEEVWREARAATLSRHRKHGPVGRRGRRTPEAGKPSVKAANLFTSLVYMKNEPVVFRSKDGVKYYCPADLSNPGVKLDHIERCLLYFLSEVKLKLGDEGAGVEEFREKEKELDQAVTRLEAQIRVNPKMASMLPTLAEWKDELDEVRKKLDVAAVPVQASYLRSQALIEKLRSCDEEERVALRRELRQAIKFVISRIDIDVDGAKFKAKKVTVAVALRDGSRRTLYYRTDGTRMSDCGVLAPMTGGKTKDLWKLTEAGLLSAAFVPDPVPFRRRGKFAGLPKIDMSVEQMRAKVKELSLAGMSAPKIGTELGISRFTVYRYLKDSTFQRPINA